MRNLSVMSALIMCSTFATPVLAHDVSASSSATVTGTASSTDLACMAAAIDAREASYGTAFSTYHASIELALKNRRDSLKAAMLIADNAERKAAFEASWKAYRDAHLAAKVKFKADKKAANDTFKTAKANCHIDSDVSDSDNDDDDDNGKHRGWLKNGKHLGAKAHLGFRLGNR